MWLIQLPKSEDYNDSVPEFSGSNENTILEVFTEGYSCLVKKNYYGL